MISATLSLTKAQLNEAVAEWLEKNGVILTDYFDVKVKTIAGDRPFDTEYTEITCCGVVVGSKI